MNQLSHPGKALFQKCGGLLCSLSLLLSSCGYSTASSSQNSRILFFSMATESEEHYQLSRMILEQVGRFARSRDFISIDQQQKGSHAIIYGSSGGNRPELASVARSLPKGVENDPEASLLAAVRRLRQYALDSEQEIHALIVTEGTEDATTLATLKSVSAEIAAIEPDTVQSICIVGLDPQLREATSTAFLPVKDRIQSGQSRIEWQKCLKTMRS